MPKTTVLRSAKARSVRPASPQTASDPDIALVARQSEDESNDGAPTLSELERRLPSHEEICTRAYLLSERRKQAGEPGDEMSDWLQAEAELLGRRP